MDVADEIDCTDDRDVDARNRFTQLVRTANCVMTWLIVIAVSMLAGAILMQRRLHTQSSVGSASSDLAAALERVEARYQVRRSEQQRHATIKAGTQRHPEGTGAIASPPAECEIGTN